MLAGKLSIGTIILSALQEPTLTATKHQYGNTDMAALKQRIARWCRELGFQHCGISDIKLETAEKRLGDWLRRRFHGSMHYMERHGLRRSRPDQLVPGTVRIISVRMDYLPEPEEAARQALDHPSRAYVSRYALGRDYHKVLRGRLRELARRIETDVGTFGYRVFVDSAPVLEKAIAEKAGLGWIGKHTNLIDRNSGSWFFLGELYTDLPLSPDEPEESHCGTCKACLDVCPTQAIVAPYQLDARRCISYLTIESGEPIPVEFRKAIGNRIYGCDDCQLFCPWNKFATRTSEPDFAPRHALDEAELVELFAWDEATFLDRTEGSAIRRIGFERWLRNIAVALGNAASSPEVIAALESRRHDRSPLVAEHVAWALAQHGQAA
jgi:epoxyqueuosine reductase